MRDLDQTTGGEARSDAAGQTAANAEPRRPQVVIVGAGFGGLSAAKALANAPVDVTVIDRRNHHLFQPLLYQVATAGLAPTQIASPIRTILRGQSNARVVLAEVTGVDVARKQIASGGRTTPFDYLVLATGATHAYFGHDDWAEHAPGLKSLEDALTLRRRILTAFEAAETACDPAERRRLLTFVVVGAGPTGVELAGAIAELARMSIATDFRAIRQSMARVLLVEAGPRVLSTFDPALSAYAMRALERLGVDVRVGAAVTALDGRGANLGDERIEAANVFWAAGVRASSAGGWLGAQLDRAGRVLVRPDLSVEGAPDVFVVGDLASLKDAAGRPVPGVAPAAKQQGEYVGRLIDGRVAGRGARPPFRYHDAGSLATIGRQAAVVHIGRFKLTGPLAWLFWSAAHIWFLIGFRNRLAVAIDWAWSYLTFERGARLITGDDVAGKPLNSHLAGDCRCGSL
ncbi:MAG TPA: NAD(P)/FAD-dependent oxidoreductase [Caulobacteraceae bacterium]|jgi:NADH dehydrogenase|nr:NAD(P)/FAD-dependent oxidoreductase [Caulobacteraceae bacterium]